jgi:ferredoxin, 2Fe-2S
MLRVVFIDSGGVRRELDVSPGSSLLEIARANGIDIEGRCEGSLACSTCHIIVDPAWFGRLAEASEDEQDMLDTVAVGLTATSRLGCQVRVTAELDGIVVHLPAGSE